MKRKKPYMPRVVMKMNTGTKVLKSKKDKANTRQALNKKTKEMALDIQRIEETNDQLQNSI